MQQPIIGIIGAEPKEVEGIIALFSEVKTIEFGMRTFYSGKLNNKDVVVVHARIGKTAAATTVTALIHHFGISELIFTGVAGGLAPGVKVGDIVVSNKLVQHDVDVRPFRPRFEIPIIGISFFESDFNLQEKAIKAAEKTIQQQSVRSKSIDLSNAKVHTGDIASGDQFIASADKKKELLKNLPTLLCTEMEGAAVAQVCYEYELPFVVIRTISDAADESADIDFPVFLEEVASPYSAAIIDQMLQ